MSSIYTLAKKCFSLVIFFISIAFFPAHIYAQCDAIDFTSNDTKGCLPTLVQFTATGIPSGSNLYWDFGKGNISGGQVMLETFSEPGTYNVKLEVHLPNGSVCTKYKAAFLTFTSVATPKFGTADTQVCSKPSTVTLRDSTPNVSRREWYIGGSLINDTSRILTHTFTSSGYKSVTLKVFDANGCSKVLSKNNYIFVHDEYKVDFCSKLTENKNRTTITAVYSPFVDPNLKDITEYRWEFPGGTPSFYVGLIPPTISYNDLSTPRDVTFSVKTKNGCVSKFVKEGLVRKYYSVVKNNYCENVYAPVTLPTYNNFTFKGFKSNKKITTKLVSGVHRITFGEAGIFDIKIGFSYTNSTCNDSIILKELFDVSPARADFIADNPTQCILPAKVNLTALYTTPISGTNTYSWTITDSFKQNISGSPTAYSSNPNFSYTFFNEGIFNVKLTVINSGGCTATITKNAFIKIAVPVPDIVFPVKEICINERIRPLNYSAPKAGNSGFTHTWTLTNKDSAGIVIKGTGRTPNFLIKIPGVYDVEYSIANGTDPNCKVTKTYTAAFKANGILADFNASKRTGCKPFVTTFTPTIRLNKPNTAPGNALTYRWKSTPAAGVVFSDSTAASPVVTFTTNGCYTIVLTVRNAYGCSTVVSKKDYICFGTVPDFTMQADGCKNQDIKITNTSKLSPTTFRWKVEPAADAVILPTATIRHPTLRFAKDGCYQVKLITGKGADINCQDSIVKTICIKAPKADFFSEDTIKSCAPVLVQFRSKSLNADSFFWDFGDGNTLLTTDTTPIHTYNFNRPSGYTVKLVAIRKFGCRDTFTIPNYMKVYGPVPSFIADKKRACDSLTVNFTNTSTGILNYYMSYGDNSPIDSNEINPHTYDFFDNSMDSNVFYPTMYSLDDSGCIAVFRDTIILYKPPVINFSTIAPTVCTSNPIQFINSSTHANKFEWDFNGDGITDDTNTNPVYVFNSTGWKNISLTASSSSGCKNTLTIDSFFYVYDKPQAAFTFSPAKPCGKDTLNFTFSGTSDVPITRYFWDFGDSTFTNDTSNLPNPSYHYRSAGLHKAVLTIFSQSGCSDTFSKIIFTPDNNPPVTPEIHYVTVTPDNLIEIVYKKADTADFGIYHLNQFSGGPATEIFTSVNVDDTVAKSNLVNVYARSYCYSLNVEDYCGLVSLPSKLHCSIHFDVTPNNGVSNRLRWTPYRGWNNVSAYEIYRKEDQGTFKLHVSLNPNDTTYLDTNLCDRMYIYYVRALHPNGKFVSTSNLDSLRPAYIYQNIPVELQRTTVVQNAFTFTSWKRSAQLNVKQYVVDKFTPGTGWQPAYKITQDNFFTDTEVDVNTKSYIYQVRVMDDCGNISPVSNPAKSILLKAEIKNDARLLTWSKYQLWQSGVKEYLIQLEDENKEFNTIDYVPGTDSQYVDSLVYDNLDFGTCYRVIAVENTAVGEQDSSVSNIRCAILPARIFIPNAFTPNGDDFNDLFKIESLSLNKFSDIKNRQFIFRIFNRWGELLFETNDIKQGWDGTYRGKPVPADVYVYTVEAYGIEGSRFYLDGTLNLLR